MNDNYPTEDFELALIDVLGPHTLADGGMSIYEAAKLMYLRGRQDGAKNKE